ncbi:hypothetical protein [Sphingomonas sp.]|uniref:hypothetical protein n=1 Tax=Sphingomonas sp. TaxID=28214 RepID=UPI000DB10033|nr:hypothetical protein [Sphingomonas sp.]PZU06759.1 MAG: hypothetical protein DI605_18235 [Sphingomonas sp.]
MTMRPLLLASFLLAAPAIAGDVSQVDVAQAEAKLSRLTKGQAAGASVRCIRPEGIVLPEAINGRALAYRTPRALYVGPLRAAGTDAGGCPWLREGRTFVTSSINGQLCAGDRVRIVETGMLLGQCVFGPFTPYMKAK